MPVYVYLPGDGRDDNACVLGLREGGEEEILQKLKEDARWLQRISDFARDAPEDVKDAVGSIRLPDVCGISAAPVRLSPEELEEKAGTSFAPESPCILSEDDVSGMLGVHDEDFRSSGEHGCSLEINAEGSLWVETPLDDYDEDAGTACSWISVDDLADLLKPVLEARQDDGGPKP